MTSNIQQLRESVRNRNVFPFTYKVLFSSHNYWTRGKTVTEPMQLYVVMKSSTKYFEREKI